MQPDEIMIRENILETSTVS